MDGVSGEDFQRLPGSRPSAGARCCGPSSGRTVEDCLDELAVLRSVWDVRTAAIHRTCDASLGHVLQFVRVGEAKASLGQRQRYPGCRMKAAQERPQPVA